MEYLCFIQIHEVDVDSLVPMNVQLEVNRLCQMRLKR